MKKSFAEKLNMMIVNIVFASILLVVCAEALRIFDVCRTLFCVYNCGECADLVFP